MMVQSQYSIFTAYLQNICFIFKIFVYSNKFLGLFLVKVSRIFPVFVAMAGKLWYALLAARALPPLRGRAKGGLFL